MLAVTNQWDQRLFANYHLVFITFATNVSLSATSTDELLLSPAHVASYQLHTIITVLDAEDYLVTWSINPSLLRYCHLL